MNIGIILTAYNSEKYIDDCLNPWVSLKEKYNITISCVSGMFKDYVDLGFQIKNKRTLRKLINNDIDYLISTGPNLLIDENNSRNNILNVLKKDNDIIWILDSDEIYTETEIENIISYTELYPNIDWFSVNFKNYIFTNKTFISGYCPPRIFRTNKENNLDRFYFDNHILYEDGSDFLNHSNLKIPRNVAWVKHFTWLNDDPRTPEKVKYQNVRFINGCNFLWNEENNKLYFNDDYYKKVGEEKPTLIEEIDKFTDNFTFNFSREKNLFFINDVIENANIFLRIYNGHNGNLLSESELTLYKGVNLFYGFEHENFYSMGRFSKFRIEVLKNGQIIHNQFLHIK